MEKEVDVKPVGIVMTCDHCKDGNLKYCAVTDFGRSDHCFYQHACEKCGDKKWLFNKYPFVKFEY